MWLSTLISSGPHPQPFALGYFIFCCLCWWCLFNFWWEWKIEWSFKVSAPNWINKQWVAWFSLQPETDFPTLSWSLSLLGPAANARLTMLSLPPFFHFLLLFLTHLPSFPYLFPFISHTPLYSFVLFLLSFFLDLLWHRPLCCYYSFSKSKQNTQNVSLAVWWTQSQLKCHG